MAFTRTESDIRAEISAAYNARAMLMRGELVNKAYFQSAESARQYFMNNVTLADLENYIASLLAELAALEEGVTLAGLVFQKNTTFPLNVTKYGNGVR